MPIIPLEILYFLGYISDVGLLSKDKHLLMLTHLEPIMTQSKPSNPQTKNV